MPEAADILERIDRAIAELQAIKATIAASLPTPAADGNGLDADDLIDTTSAAARFGYPQDTIRKWCRTEGLGVMRGGRWLVSVPRLQRRLNGK